MLAPLDNVASKLVFSYSPSCHHITLNMVAAYRELNRYVKPLPNWPRLMLAFGFSLSVSTNQIRPSYTGLYDENSRERR